MISRGERDTERDRLLKELAANDRMIAAQATEISRLRRVLIATAKMAERLRAVASDLEIVK